MKSCEACKVVIDEGIAFCPRCGRPVASELAPDAASKVDHLLAEANLHRIRGEYDAAIDKCTEALQLNPCDPETHSLLGDVYDSRGNLEEAARWYQMAIELRPVCALDEAKLERVRLRLAVSHQDDRSNVTGGLNRTLLGGSKLDTAMRYVIIFSAAAVVLLLAIGLFAWLMRQHPPEQSETPIVRPRTESRDGGKQPVETSAATVTASEVLVRPAAEQQVLSNLATNPVISNRRLIVEDVNADPRRKTLMVTFRDPTPAHSLSRLRLLQDASTVATAAFAASSDSSTVTIRALANFPGKANAPEPHLVMMCDVPRRAAGVDATILTEAQLTNLFADVWWGAEIK